MLGMLKGSFVHWESKSGLCHVLSPHGWRVVVVVVMVVVVVVVVEGGGRGR